MLFFYLDFNQTLSHENSLPKRLLRVTLPFLFVYGLLGLYITLGAYLFDYVDHEMSKHGIANLTLFCFTTIATIGYGNIYPTNDYSRVVCVIYCLIGIPLCLVCLDSTVKTVARMYWLINSTVRKVRQAWFRGEIRLPFCVAGCLLMSTFLLKTLCFEERFHFTLDDLYFCVVSFSTVGLGDIVVTSNTLAESVYKTIFLMYGVVCTSAFFTIMGQWYLNRIRNREENIPVDGVLMVGGQQIRLKQLLCQISSKLNVAPSELRSIVKEMKELIEISDQL